MWSGYIFPIFLVFDKSFPVNKPLNACAAVAAFGFVVRGGVRLRAWEDGSCFVSDDKLQKSLYNLRIEMFARFFSNIFQNFFPRPGFPIGTV